MSSPKAILGLIWGSPGGLEGQLSVFGTRFSVPFGAQESSMTSVEQSVTPRLFFSGSAAVAAGLSLVSEEIVLGPEGERHKLWE